MREDAEEQDLRSEILANPDVDGPRLAYADFCQKLRSEAQLARAQVIRLQVKGFKDPHGQEQRQARDLISQFHERWTPRVQIHYGICSHEYHRGFIEKIDITAKAWLAFHQEICSVFPIQHLNILESKSLIADVFSSSSLERVKSISLKQQDLEDSDLQLIVTGRTLPKLRWLSLAWNKISREGIHFLAECKTMPNLGWVSLSGNPFDPNIQFSTDHNGFIVETWDSEDTIWFRDHFGDRPWLTFYPTSPWNTEPDRFIF